jgi:hypothetical protein
MVTVVIVKVIDLLIADIGWNPKTRTGECTRWCHTVWRGIGM